MDKLTERVNALEKRADRYRNLAAIMAFVMVVGFMVAAKSRPNDLVQCKRLELLDNNGKVRAELTVDENGQSRLTLMGTKEPSAITLKAGTDFGYITMFDSNNKQRMCQGFDEMESGVSFFAEDGESNARFTVEKSDVAGPQYSIFYGDTLVLTANQDMAGIDLMGKVAIKATKTSSGLAIFDSAKNLRSVIGYKNDNNIKFELYDKKGKALFSAP